MKKKNKISLSIRATEEAPKEQPTKKKQVSSSENDEGFNTLRDKLEEWIKKADK